MFRYAYLALFLAVVLIAIFYDPSFALVALVGVPHPVLNAVQERRLFTSTMVANTTQRHYSPDFPRSLYSHLDCYLSGTLTKDETCAGTLADNALSLIRGIRIKADGDIVKEFEPAAIRPLSHHIFRGQDTNLAMVTLGDDTAEAFSARFLIDLQSPRTRLPEASYLPGDRYGELAFEVDWGAMSDLVGGGTYASSSFPTTPTLVVRGVEHLNPALRARPYLIHKYFTKTFSQSSTAETARVCQLPVGETYRGILLRQLTRTPDLGISTLITATGNIVVRVNGSYRKVETTWRDLTQQNQADYGIAMPTGFAFIDFMRDGDYGKALQTGDSVGVTNLELLVDMASVASAFLQVVGVTYKPAKSAA